MIQPELAVRPFRRGACNAATILALLAVAGGCATGTDPGVATEAGGSSEQSSQAATTQPGAATAPPATAPPTTLPPTLPDRTGPVIRFQDDIASTLGTDWPADIAEGTLRLIDNCLLLEEPGGFFQNALVFPYGTTWDATTQTVDMGPAFTVDGYLDVGGPVEIDDVAALVDEGHLTAAAAAELQRCIDLAGKTQALVLG